MVAAISFAPGIAPAQGQRRSAVAGRDDVLARLVLACPVRNSSSRRRSKRQSIVPPAWVTPGCQDRGEAAVRFHPATAPGDLTQDCRHRREIAGDLLEAPMNDGGPPAQGGLR